MSKVHAAFQKCEASIRRVIARYCPRDADIDELTQETFLKCFAAELKAEIREPERLLLHAARNVALSEIKKKRNTTTSYLEDMPLQEGLADTRQMNPEQELISRSKLATLVEAMSELSGDDQKMLVMRKIHNLKHTQIAASLNVSVSTVQKRLAAALVTCASRLVALGYDPVEFGGPDAPSPSSPEGDGAVTSQRKTEHD